MRGKLVSVVHQISYHRNGIAGAGFHAVLFDSTGEICAGCHGGDSIGWVDGLGNVVPCRNCGATALETVTCRMLATVFDEPGHVAVVDVLKLSDPKIGVAFGGNSWRGDRFEAELRQAIATGDSDGSVRVGPFSIPVARATAGKASGS